MTHKEILVYRVATISILAFLVACGELPDVNQLNGVQDAQDKMEQNFIERETDPIQRILVSRDAFRPIEITTDIRSDIGDKTLELKFSEGATLKDLVTVLGVLNVPIVVNSEEGMDVVMDGRLPFSSYRGTLSDLLDILRRASSVISQQKGDFIYLGTFARYSVDLPQDPEIMGTISAEITALGGDDVVESVTSGQLIYKAKPDVHDNLIGPFLDRVSDNLAMITMQVAVVSLALNDSTSQGFDWNAFRLGITRVNRSVDASSNATDIGQEVPALGSVIDATSSAFSVGHTTQGTLFGKAATFTIGSALNFLSTFGETEITQNVELRTLSGQEVVLRSGQEVPFVSGVTNTVDEGTSTGSVETEKIQTGLTLTLKPFFDSATGLVTLNLDLQQRQILQFVELSAGNGVGTITQPLTQDQNLTDLIRTPVGQTIVVGGVQNENVSSTTTQPSFIRGKDSAGRIGSENRNVSRNAFFIVARPTVTVFERASDE